MRTVVAGENATDVDFGYRSVIDLSVTKTVDNATPLALASKRSDGDGEAPAAGAEHGDDRDAVRCVAGGADVCVVDGEPKSHAQ